MGHFGGKSTIQCIDEFSSKLNNNYINNIPTVSPEAMADMTTSHLLLKLM